MITIFNGNLCYDYKIQQFKNWVDAFNTRYNKNVKFKVPLVKPSFSNAWLSGFIDAEGCFTGRVKKSMTNKLKEAPLLTFSISQKNDSILKKIA